MSYQCPWCPTVGTYRNNILKHLCGLGPKGHELTEFEAESVISAIDARADIDIAPRAGGRAPNGLVPLSAAPATPVTAGHRQSLACLRDADAVRETLARYKRSLFGTHVYLRPTDAGLTVISLDAEQCPSMIGVGGRNTAEHVLATLPPSDALVRQAAAGYFLKRDGLRRRSEEERFVLRCIRHALTNALRLPGAGWAFLHQEWRFPSSDGGGKADLLAIDVPSHRLVVIECKSSERATTVPDSSGRVAAEQAAHYADLVHRHRGELYPFFNQLAAALAAVYDGRGLPESFELDPEHQPGTEVWWPGNPIP